MKTKALITGINGQDGSYLTEFLLEKQYEVHGIIREHSNPNPYISNAVLHTGDLADQDSLQSIIKSVRPNEIYNLAAQSSVGKSFAEPELTSDINALGALRLLEAIRTIDPTIKYYQAGSSEMFGNTSSPPPFNEETPFQPVSPYGYAKVFAHHATRQYRESHGIFACNGILFNHESPRRGEQFVTRKITMGVAKIKAGLQDKLFLGNLDARRDWGYAPEYVEAMWLMLQQDKPDDYVIATGEAHSIQDFVIQAFKNIGVGNWKKYVKINDSLKRSNDINVTVGNAKKAENQLGWKAKIMFNDLVALMVDSERQLI